MSLIHMAENSNILDAAAIAESQTRNLTNSAQAWAEALNGQFSVLGSAITDPSVTVTWDDIESSVPITWGAAYSAPTLPTATAISGPASNTLTGFSFTDETYTPDLKVDAMGLLGSVMSGAPLMPQAAWDDAYTTVENDLTALYSAAVLQAGRVAGMFSELPGPALLARVDKAVTDHRQGIQKARLALAAEQAKAQREDMTSALDGARQHDQAFAVIHGQEKGRSLQAAQSVTDASAKIFAAIWQSIQTQYAARLAAMQADAVPAQLQIDSEKTRNAVEMQVLAKALENAKLAQGKGVAEAQLLVQRLQFVDGQALEVQKVIAQLMAHMAGSYMTAGNISYSYHASETFGISNSGDACPCP